MLRVIDDVADFDSGETDHPGFAHFHRLAADLPQAFPPFTLINPANGNPRYSPPTLFVRGDIYELGRGSFPNDVSMSWTGIGMHQWERPDEQRHFTLRLIPLPEPGTLALFVVCCAALLCSVRRKAASLTC
jgi:hypothetical protein